MTIRNATRLVLTALALMLIAANLVTTNSPPHAAPDAGKVSALRLADLFGSAHSIIGRSYVIGGLGSSVGAGATLGDPADAPAPYFTARLQRRLDPSGLARWVVVNDSVPGSTVHDGVARDWATLKRAHPDVVVLAYGMNDGAPAQFTAGETYAGTMQGITMLITEIRASGAVPVLLTTPSPHTGRSDLQPWPGLSIPQVTPLDTSKPVRDVLVPKVGVAPESTRHAAINAGFREIARSMDVDLIDVEPYWLRAVASRGQDALFNPGEFVHPNLLGHRLSYHAAIASWDANPSTLDPFPTGWVSTAGNASDKRRRSR